MMLPRARSSTTPVSLGTAFHSWQRSGHGWKWAAEPQKGGQLGFASRPKFLIHTGFPKVQWIKNSSNDSPKGHA